MHKYIKWLVSATLFATLLGCNEQEGDFTAYTSVIWRLNSESVVVREGDYPALIKKHQDGVVLSVNNMDELLIPIQLEELKNDEIVTYRGFQGIYDVVFKGEKKVIASTTKQELEACYYSDYIEDCENMIGGYDRCSTLAYQTIAWRPVEVTTKTMASGLNIKLVNRLIGSIDGEFQFNRALQNVKSTKPIGPCEFKKNNKQ
jgi:hypothetical protein